MKKIVYTRTDGGISIFHATDGARLVNSITIAGHTYSVDSPVAADTLIKGWPITGASVSWAETEDEFIARIQARVVPNGASNVQQVEADSIPVDRTFRGAWKLNGSAVACDMGKAREIQKDRLREIRAPLLAALDIEFMRALETGDAAKQAEVIAQKNALRDVTDDPAIMAASTPEELKAVVPEILTQIEAQIEEEVK